MKAHAVEYGNLGALQARPYKPDLRRRYVQQPPRELPLLTTRQAQIVAWVRNGVHSTKEIAWVMGCSVGGTKEALRRLYERLRKRGYAVDNLTSLAIFAFAPEVLQQKG